MVVVLLARGSAPENIDILYLNLDAAECYCSACFRRFWNKDTEMRQLIAVNVKRWGRSGRHIKPLVCEGGEHFQSKNIKVSLLFKCMYRCDNVCKQLNLFLDHECPNMAHFLRNWAMFSTKARKLRCSGLFDNMLGQGSVQKHANEIHNPHRRHPNKKKTHKGKWERGCMDQYTQGRLIRHRSQGRESQSQWREKKKTGSETHKERTAKDNRKCRLETSNRNTGSEQSETEPCFVGLCWIHHLSVHSL